MIRKAGDQCNRGERQTRGRNQLLRFREPSLHHIVVRREPDGLFELAGKMACRQACNARERVDIDTLGEMRIDVVTNTLLHPQRQSASIARRWLQQISMSDGMQPRPRMDIDIIRRPPYARRRRRNESGVFMSVVSIDKNSGHVTAIADTK